MKVTRAIDLHQPDAWKVRKRVCSNDVLRRKAQTRGSDSTDGSQESKLLIGDVLGIVMEHRRCSSPTALVALILK